MWLIFWMNKFLMFLHFTFLRITMITDRAVVQSFLCMNWLSRIFQNDSFRKIIVTNLACFVTSCPHENNWHVFSNCLFQKNWTHKLSNYVTYLLNEQIQDVFTIHFFWEQAWSQIEMLINYFSILTGSVSVCSFKLNFS